MNFRTGDIITARIRSLPLFLHKGIIVIDDDGSISIYHNTPTEKNSAGGGIIKDSFDDWVLSRDIINVEQTGMTRAYIEQTSYELSDRPFNISSFNCEQYISLLKDGRRKSPQLLQWGLLVLLILAARKSL